MKRIKITIKQYIRHEKHTKIKDPKEEGVTITKEEEDMVEEEVSLMIIRVKEEEDSTKTNLSFLRNMINIVKTVH